MALKEHPVRLRRTLQGDPARVWALLADTDRLDRMLGVSPGAYRWRTLPDGSRERIGSARQFGLALEWVEPPYEWVEGAYIAGLRRYLRGPVTTGGFRAHITPKGTQGADVEMVAYLTGEGAAVSLLAGAMSLGVRQGLGRYLDAVQQLVALEAPPGEGLWTLEAARRALAGARESALVGPSTPVASGEYAVRAERLRALAGLSEAARERVLSWLCTAPDEEVERARPFALADQWGLDPREVLRVFLHATRAGLVDLRWSLECPVCRVSAGAVGALADVGRRVHCGACNVDYDTDFSERVEAVFLPNHAVRPVEPKVYCASSALFRPHLFASLVVGTEPRTFRARLPKHPLAVTALGRSARTVYEPDPEGPTPETLTVTVRDGTFALHASGQSPDGRTALTFVKETADPWQVQLERTGRPAHIVTGATLLLFPDYLDLFAADAPAQGLELQVGAAAVLFTDLTGSTALYERVGDARAFALVQQHFRAMTAAVAREGGAVVKTMGDAVMATFPALPAAVRAALEMVRSTAREQGPEGIALKVGVHQGACLAVRANDRLDFFGSTVNIAARLQAQAGPGEVVLLASALEHPEVRDLLQKLPSRAWSASLKGVRSAQALVSINVQPSSLDKPSEPS